jgi:hypothetical protein
VYSVEWLNGCWFGFACGRCCCLRNHDTLGHKVHNELRNLPVDRRPLDDAYYQMQVNYSLGISCNCWRGRVKCWILQWFWVAMWVVEEMEGAYVTEASFPCRASTAVGRHQSEWNLVPTVALSLLLRERGRLSFKPHSRPRGFVQSHVGHVAAYMAWKQVLTQ